ncbi:cathelicidin-6-like isoform 2-T2 [Discoglossus pictus]
MDSWFQLVLVLGATTPAYSAAVIGSLDSNAIRKVIDIYNAGLDVSVIFKLLSNDLQYTQSDTYEGKKLKFIIKETLCLKSRQQNTEDCAFKDNGEVRNCTATFNGQGGRDIIISCDTLTSMNMKEETEETEKNSNVHNPQIKKRSLNLLVSNKKLSNTTTTNTVSCLQCIFDIFGTNS